MIPQLPARISRLLVTHITPWSGGHVTTDALFYMGKYTLKHTQMINTFDTKITLDSYILY